MRGASACCHTLRLRRRAARVGALQCPVCQARAFGYWPTDTRHLDCPVCGMSMHTLRDRLDEEEAESDT